jgi:hypothetical protein
MKIVDFFFIIWGKWFELEPELQFFTSGSRSWSRAKMDRHLNTATALNMYEGDIILQSFTYGSGRALKSFLCLFLGYEKIQ